MRSFISVVMVGLLCPGSAIASEVFKCVVDRVNQATVIVSCNTRNKSSYCLDKENLHDANCIQTILDIPIQDWDEFKEWGDLLPKNGQLLKAEWRDGEFTPLPGCKERIKKLRDAYCGETYCRPPMNSLHPEDCY